MDLLFSVCICTRNRADLLAAALDSACRQSLDRARYEVLVIDNASTDATSQVAAEFAARYPHVRCCLEPQVGLSHARNRAAVEARAPWLAYLDDDALAPPGWLAVAEEMIAAHHPNLLGGPFTALYTTPKPAWFRDAYAAVDQGPQARCLQPHEYLAGGNLFIRRELLLAAGGFPLDFGMAGGRIAYGEETVLQRRLRRRDPGVCIFYAPGLSIRHRVAPRRMRLLPELRRRFLAGRWNYRTFAGERHSLSVLHLLAFLFLPLWIAGEALLGVGLRPRRRYPHWQNYVYEVVFGHVGRWGKLFERLRCVLRRGGGA